MAKTRVLVVDDSLTVRRRIVEVLAQDPELEVVGEAEDGKRAVDLCQALRPDVLTLDMMLPVMTGLSVTEFVMAHCPTPILIVSSSTNRGNLFKTYDALAAGAVDVLEKPMGDEPADEWEKKLVSSVKLVARIKVITHLKARLNGLSRGPSTPVSAALPRVASSDWRAVALGASTGGPNALVQVLRAFAPPVPVPVLVVLHLDAMFSASFAEWLADQTGHEVSFARDGEALSATVGKVLLAPSGQHLRLRAGVTQLSLDEERHSCRPSIDVLFESLATDFGRGTIACLLTGMGRDGAAGLLDIRRAGGVTIAQDEASSVVFGMPREAALLGAPERVLALSDIGPAVAELLRQKPAGVSR